jgi:glycosyltransferase involved in cell wall biosynthesis
MKSARIHLTTGNGKVVSGENLRAALPIAPEQTEARAPSRKPTLFDRASRRFARDSALLNRLCGILCAKTTEDTSVCYGHEHIPSPSENARGGIVKFQRMQHLYPNTPVGHNVLYMVSSMPPYGSGWIARAAGVKGAKIVWNQNGVAYPGAYPDGSWKKRNRRMARILTQADHVFYQSEFCKLSADRYLGRPNGKWDVLYNAVDTDFFRPGSQPEDTDNRLNILLGGTQYQYYRFEAAILALREVRKRRPEARLLVTGNLIWTDELSAHRQARELMHREGQTDSVDFLGPYLQQDAPSVFSQADILLHTKYNDPSPGLIIEAMACGLPVVYSDSGGVPEMVGAHAGIGLKVPHDWDRDHLPEPGAFARGIIDVADHLDTFSVAARHRAVEQFDLAPWLERHHEVFEGLRK